jgi:hypothetical protein
MGSPTSLANGRRPSICRAGAAGIEMAQTRGTRRRRHAGACCGRRKNVGEKEARAACTQRARHS